MDADDLCIYLPQGKPLVNPLIRSENVEPEWSPDAQQRLSRIPTFLRLMIKKRAEAYVSELGEAQITCQHLSDLAAARFGSNKRPSFPGSTVEKNE